MTRTGRQLAAVLTDLGLIENGEPIRIQRLRPGRHLRTHGAWSWIAVNRQGDEVAGSAWNVGEVIRAHHAGNVVIGEGAFGDTSRELIVEGYMNAIIYRGAVYRLADEPDESVMVEELESSPIANWEEYQQPIIRALKQQLGHDGISLLSPSTDVAFVSPEFGFNIIGDVGFSDERPIDVVNKYGTGPLPFSAYVTPDGKLTFPISLGTAADVKFRKVL